ncbi:RING finger protein narya [Colletes gigas]|uniref:RING finger protein narya n=1 Tax=Colletes gigas TaxID=935657 RepID=UPI001C9A2E45|nr:RING finger protein narya [Colletes gigas]XP_043251145.1 RING finger protein narya [Colletes gigas]XP_043251147.1 RING finger protein narya [Colletes gigas]XP_043251148.1 RING finger protein narya [Colletes gigas]XP_043251149.1 RING finger protein narya [Colletes gigas]
MDLFICNKCSITTQRGKKPFCLTQCGHIYCNGCIQQAEKQCPQCQQMGVYSVELQQPSLARVENFFAPVTESLESLNKICGFQNNQTKLVIQRFYEIDKKYEMLKSHYYNLSQSMKILRDKYMKLKVENVDQRKKLMSIEIQNRTLNSMSSTSTPFNPTNRRNKGRNTGNSYLLSCGTNMSSQSYNTGKGNTILEGFRIPNPQSVKLIAPNGDSNTRSTYTFTT